MTRQILTVVAFIGASVAAGCGSNGPGTSTGSAGLPTDDGYQRPAANPDDPVNSSDNPVPSDTSPATDSDRPVPNPDAPVPPTSPAPRSGVTISVGGTGGHHGGDGSEGSGGNVNTPQPGGGSEVCVQECGRAGSDCAQDCATVCAGFVTYATKCANEISAYQSCVASAGVTCANGVVTTPGGQCDNQQEAVRACVNRAP